MKTKDTESSEFFAGTGRAVLVYSLVIISLALLIAYLVNNTFSLTQVLNEDARLYSEDIVKRTERDVVARLGSLENRVRAMANGLRVLPEEEMAPRLSRLIEASTAFDGVVLVDETGFVTRAGKVPVEFSDWVLEQQGLFTDVHVGSTSGADCIISSPVPGTSRPMALICRQSDSDIREALNGVTDAESCFSCIAHESGEIAMLPSGDIPADEFALLTSAETEMHFAAFVENVKTGDPHDPLVVLVSDETGEMSYMACAPVGVGDWYLITFVPESLFSEHADVYIQRYWAPIILCCVSFLVLLAGIWHSRRQGMAELENLLYTDSLTGGLTDAAFQKEARRLIRSNSGAPYHVACYNVLEFHNIMERYGDKIAYSTLARIHASLKTRLKSDELLARSERDHFYLLLHAADLDELGTRVDDLLEVILKTAVEVAPMGNFSVARGACSVGSEMTNIRLLEARAARASRYSEELGRCVFYRRDLETKIGREIALEETFEACLAAGSFEVYLQPKVALAAGSPLCAEALVRWNHPKLGQISPAEFVPLFERNRKVHQLDVFVFETVCSKLSEWNAQGGPLAGLPVSVNLSRVCLSECGLDIIRRFAALKDEYGIPDGQLEIEITETVSLDSGVLDLLREGSDLIHKHGMSCSFDDFGFGYSSLSLLKDLDLDAIKLDRHFFIDANERCWKIVGAFIDLAHSLGMTIIAEGVEFQDQLERLRLLGCDYVQGYYFSRPLPIEEFVLWAAVRESR